MMRYFWIIVLVCGIGVVPTSAQQATINEANLTIIWEQIAAQPDDFAVACMPINNPRGVVFHNAGLAFPLASVSKVLILIEYAQRVDTGIIPLEEIVNVQELERYNLPRTDRGAHDRFMERYPAGTQNISLWDVATEGMIQYSSNAASDYLLNRMAPIDWNALQAQLAVLPLTYPNPLTMIPLLMNNHETGLVTEEKLPTLSMAQGESFLAKYIQDVAWRDAEIAYRAGFAGGGQRGGFSSRWPAWDVQSAILQEHTAVGTTNDFRNIMLAIYTDAGILSPNVQYIVRSALQWRNSNFVNQNYVEYGSKLGFYSGGTLTLAAYGQPIDGNPVISIIFFRNIPRFRYYEMVREDSIGDFAHWLNLTGCNNLQSRLVALTT